MGSDRNLPLPDMNCTHQRWVHRARHRRDRPVPIPRTSESRVCQLDVLGRDIAGDHPPSEGQGIRDGWRKGVGGLRLSHGPARTSPRGAWSVGGPPSSCRPGSITWTPRWPCSTTTTYLAFSTAAQEQLLQRCSRLCGVVGGVRRSCSDLTPSDGLKTCFRSRPWFLRHGYAQPAPSRSVDLSRKLLKGGGSVKNCCTLETTRVKSRGFATRATEAAHEKRTKTRCA